MKKKRIWAILISLFLAAGMFPGGVFAAEAGRDAANLTIAGIPITNEEGELKAGKGTVAFTREGDNEEERITLTLDRATITAAGAGRQNGQSSSTEPLEALIQYTGRGTLVISLEGESHLSGKEVTYGIYAPNGTVTIKGKAGGALQVDAAPENSNAIRAGEIIIEEPMEITAPENTYIYQGNNPDFSAYKTIAYSGGGRNLAATSATIRSSASAQDREEAGSDKDEDDRDSANADKDDKEADREDKDSADADRDDKEADREDKDSADADKDDKEDLADADERASADKEETASGDTSSDRKENLSDRIPALTILGEKVTSSRGDIDVKDGEIRFETTEDDEGKETVTLTLNGASLKAGGTGSLSGPAIEYDGEGTLVILLQGKNTLRGETEYGIYVPEGTVRIRGEAGSSLKVEAAPEDSNAVRAETVLVEKSMEITDPEDGYIFKGDNGGGTTYQTIAFDRGGGAMAATSVTFRSTKDAPEGAQGEDADAAEKDGDDRKASAPGSETGAEQDAASKEDSKSRVWTVKFAKNGGTGKMDALEVAKGAKLTLPSCTFKAPAGKEFQCWQIGGDSFSAGSEVRITDDTTVKALWREEAPPHTHILTETEAVEPSCTEDGNIAFFTCQECGRIFRDAEGTQEILPEETVLKARHDWDYSASVSKETGAATFIFTCKKDPSHNEKVSVRASDENMTLPTKTEDGSIKYETVFEGKKYYGSKPVPRAGADSYTFTANPGSWRKKSTNTMSFTVTRAADDVITFAAFRSAAIDGETIKNENSSAYVTERGSLKITLRPAWLEKLAEGTHTLTVEFTDGSAQAQFTIKAAPPEKSGT